MSESVAPASPASDGTIVLKYLPPENRRTTRGRMQCFDKITGVKVDSDRLDIDDSKDRRRYVKRLAALLEEQAEGMEYDDGAIDALVNSAMREKDNLHITGHRKPAPIFSVETVEAERDEGPRGHHDEYEGGGDDEADARPEILLPGGHVTVSAAAMSLGKLLDKRGGYYIRGDKLFTVTADQDDPTKLSKVLTLITPAILVSEFEKVADLRKLDKEGGMAPAICPEQTAKVISYSSPFRDALPKIRLLSNCPVLIVRQDRLVQVAGYDRESGILASGKAVEWMDAAEAVNVLELVLKDFKFATRSDKSRAFAALITPALIQGGLLGGRAPYDLGEADQSQTGKGFRNKLTTAIYNTTVQSVTQKKERSGVGSMEEKFDSKLVKGYSFIALDNVRGQINSAAFESFATEDNYAARVPYADTVDIDPRRVVIQITSNKAEITIDLANRCSATRILKQAEGYPYAKYAEGEILEHIRANQPRFLGAVFSIIKAWFDADMPKTSETRHHFRRWAGTLDWIVQHLLRQPALLDGHKETQARMANPALNWMRDVAMAIARSGGLKHCMQTRQIVSILEADGTVDIPGLREGQDASDDAVRKGMLQAVGKRFGQAFNNSVAMPGRPDVFTVTVDGFSIERETIADHQRGRQVKKYLFARSSDQTAPPEEANVAPTSEGS